MSSKTYNYFFFLVTLLSLETTAFNRQIRPRFKSISLKCNNNINNNDVDTIAVTNSSSADDVKRVVWTASAKGTVRVNEVSRTVEDYMKLPSSEYSVLSANQIERLNDREFKCTLGTLNFFGVKITPVLFVDVNVIPDENKSIISVTRAETIGSDIAEKVNGTFSILAINTVFSGSDNKNRKTLTSETSLTLDCIVSSDSNLPLRVIESGGNFLIQSTLTVIVQAFVRILAADFKRWSAGSNIRDAVTDEKIG
jgi:hypothetical protein